MGKRGESRLRPQRRLHGIAGREAGMQRLAHGSEVADIAAGHRIDDAERMGGPLRIEIEQLAARRRRPEGPDGAGGVPAAVERMARLRGAPELGHDLEADHVGVQHVAPRCIDGLGEREYGRHERHARMSDQAPGHVVIVERMRGGAVDQSGIVRRGLEILAPDGCVAGARAVAGPCGRDRAGRMARAGERHADAILHRPLGDRERLRRDRFEPGRDDVIDDVLGVLHQSCVSKPGASKLSATGSI